MPYKVLQKITAGGSVPVRLSADCGRMGVMTMTELQITLILLILLVLAIKN
jgi:hypothetical protein